MLAAYLAAGEDRTKRDVVHKRFCAKLDEGIRDFNIDNLDATTLTPEELSTALNSLPFAAPFRIVYIVHAEALTGPLSDVIADYVKAASSNTSSTNDVGDEEPPVVALLDTDTLDKRTKVYKAIAKLGKEAIIDCGVAKPWEMPAYAVKRAQAYGITMTQEAAKELVSRTGEASEAINNALQRLAAEYPGQAVSQEHVRQAIADTRAAKPWEIVDALCNQNAAYAFSKLGKLDQAEILTFHHFFIERIRELICTKDVLKKDAYATADVIAEAFYAGDAAAGRRLGWKFKNHTRWSSAYSMAQLKKALEAARKAEACLKGRGDALSALYEMAAALLLHTAT